MNHDRGAGVRRSDHSLSSHCWPAMPRGAYNLVCRVHREMRIKRRDCMIYWLLPVPLRAFLALSLSPPVSPCGPERWASYC